jgi:integrase/recombinase XerD
LIAIDRSPNTVRVYAGRVAVFLSWCEREVVGWRTVSVVQLGRFRRWLELTPWSSSGRGEQRFRQSSAVSGHLTAVCEFLRFAGRRGWVAPAVVEQLSEPRFVVHLPPGFDPGERGQFRRVRSPMIRVRVAEQFPEALDAADLDRLLTACDRVRDRLLVSLMALTGMRIGECLGLRREDMHLLPDSRVVGCGVEGPHVHVRRRANPNGALAKSRFPRSVPVTDGLVRLYADYRYQRDWLAGDADSDMVFVNLYAAPVGQALKYPAAKAAVDRAAQRAGVRARPHMLRHTAASRWVRAGVGLDVVRSLLGHASLQSTSVYLHADDQARRAAIELVASSASGPR